MEKFATLLALWFYAGRSLKAPGTMGTIAALPFAALMHYAVGIWLVGVMAVLFFFIGWWASHIYMVANNRLDDPKEVVIDEVVGMWLSISAMPLMHLNPTIETMVGLYIAAFIAFRFFDILKPWPISLADRRIKGAFGVMLDDVLAALFALLVLGIIGHFLTGVGVIDIPMGGGDV